MSSSYWCNSQIMSRISLNLQNWASMFDEGDRSRHFRLVENTNEWLKYGGGPTMGNIWVKERFCLTLNVRLWWVVGKALLGFFLSLCLGFFRHSPILRRLNVFPVIPICREVWRDELWAVLLKRIGVPSFPQPSSSPSFVKCPSFPNVSFSCWGISFPHNHLFPHLT